MRWDSIGDFCSRLIILNADHISVVLLEMWRFPGGEKFIRIRGGAGVGRVGWREVRQEVQRSGEYGARARAAGSLLQYGITPAERASEEWLRMVVSYHGVRSLWNTEGPVKDTTMVRLVGYYHAILREK